MTGSDRHGTHFGKRFVSRADLVLLLDEFGEDALKQACTAGRYQRTQEDPERGSNVTVSTQPVEATGPAPKSSNTEEEPLTFWYPYAVDILKRTADNEPAWYRNEISHTKSDFRPINPPKPPPHQDLCHWRRLWPFLHEALGEMQTSTNIDLPQAVKYIAEVKPMRRLPMQKRHGWARRCTLLLDFNKRLVPFREDMRRLLINISKIRGKNGLDLVIAPDGSMEPVLYQREGTGYKSRFKMPEAGTPVLIAGDLGLFATLKEQNDWIRFGEKLRRAGLAPIVLTPAPRRIWSFKLAFLFKMAYWDRTPETPRLTGSGAKGLRPLPHDQGLAGIQKLKTLLAPAVRVEPRLLRAVRLLLPADRADAGHEAGVWNHPDIISTYTGFSFRTEFIKELRRRFITDISKETQHRICDLIQTHHRHLSTAVTGEEKMIADLLKHGSPSQTSERYFRRSAKALSETDYRRQWPGLGAWLWRVVVQRQDVHLWQSEAMAVIWALINYDDWDNGKIDLPEGLPPASIMWVLAKKGELEHYTLFRQGGHFVVKKSFRSQPLDQAHYILGSPVADLVSSNGVLQIYETGINPETKYALNLQNTESVAFEVPTGNRLQLLTNHTEITLKNTQKPSWAKGWGRDEKGLFLILPHGDQMRKAYWFAPGRYPVGDDANSSIDIDHGFWWDEHDFRQSFENRFQKPEWAHDFRMDRYGIYAEFHVRSVTQRMRWIMPGRFMMGSLKSEPERDDDEEQHEVILTKGFWLAETTCTQALWQAVMGDNPSGFRGDNLPVETVSWEECQTFITKLNAAVPGLNLSLPTEAQWEYACRAGITTPFHFGATITTDQANFNGGYPYNNGPGGEYRKKTVPVKTFPCNAWGLYEMHGNIWEWCADWYGPYPKDAVVDPTGPNEGQSRVLRGGSWFSYGGLMRCADRGRDDPAGRFVFDGLRLARGQTAGQGSGGAGQSKEDSDQPITLSNTVKRDKKSGFFKGIFKK